MIPLVIGGAVAVPLVWILAHLLERIERAAQQATGPIPAAERPLRVWRGVHDWSARGEL